MRRVLSFCFVVACGSRGFSFSSHRHLTSPPIATHTLTPTLTLPAAHHMSIASSCFPPSYFFPPIVPFDSSLGRDVELVQRQVNSILSSSKESNQLDGLINLDLAILTGPHKW